MEEIFLGSKRFLSAGVKIILLLVIIDLLVGKTFAKLPINEIFKISEIF